jgi:hypothetical protein
MANRKTNSENKMEQNPGQNPEKMMGAPTEGATENAGTVEVLYQKMGDRWFAFSLVDDEVFVGSITPEEINSGNA